jgi:hypothetical protein
MSGQMGEFLPPPAKYWTIEKIVSPVYPQTQSVTGWLLR